MRVTVGTVVGLVAAGRTRDEILREYPYLEAEDIAEALSYEAWGAEAVVAPIAALASTSTGRCQFAATRRYPALVGMDTPKNQPAWHPRELLPRLEAVAG
jgi:hypothetical protein